MSTKLLPPAAMAVALFTLSAVAFAPDEADETTHDGRMVSLAGDKLVMTTKAGRESKEHVHRLAPTAEMTLDGKPCKAADLKAGTKIRVTMQTGDAKLATHVEAIVKQPMFAHTHEGTVVSITSDRLVMTDKDGTEHSHSVSAHAKVSCDGKVCKTGDLKAGMKIRVTTRKSDTGVAIAIEAIELNPEFVSL